MRLALEQLSKEADARNRAIVAAALDCIITIDHEGRVIEFNPAAERTFGYDAAEVIGRDMAELIVPPELREVHRRGLARYVETGEATLLAHPTEVIAMRADASRFPAELTITRIPLPGPPIFTGFVRDISERRQLRAELELRVDELERERDLLRTVVDTAPTFFCGLDAEGTIVRFNRALEDLRGVADDDGVRGRPFWDVFVAPDEQAEVAARFRASVAGSQNIEYENRWRRAAGGMAVVAWFVNWYEGDRGQDRYLITGTDVTAREQHAAELERQLEFVNTVANATTSLLCVIDADGRVVERTTNIAFEQLLGYDASEVGRLCFWEHFVQPEDTGDVRRRIEAAMSGLPTGEYDSAWRTRTGERLLVAWSCTALPSAEGERLYLICGTNITERKQQEEELRRSRSRIVAAADDERRRLERNLHDGAQQRLVTLALTLRLAQERLKHDPEAAAQLLAAASEELGQALQELRELARGLHPAVLTEHGLAASLRTLAARSPVPVEVRDVAEDLPAPVQVAAYYVVSEALTNVAKYSRAARATVSVARVDRDAVVEIVDDGVGGADFAGGSGLRGLGDRVAALDGRLEVVSPPGAGTRVRAEIPLG